jgi:hypothetical protein
VAGNVPQQAQAVVNSVVSGVLGRERLGSADRPTEGLRRVDAALPSPRGDR